LSISLLLLLLLYFKICFVQNYAGLPFLHSRTLYHMHLQAHISTTAIHSVNIRDLILDFVLQMSPGC